MQSQLVKRIDDAGAAIMRMRWFIRLPILFLCVAFIVVNVGEASLVAALAIGFRDGCIEPGTSSCAISLKYSAQIVIVPLTVWFLFISLITIFSKKVWGYRVLFACLLISCLQLIVLGNDFFEVTRKLIR
jgi:hypothetical protein